MPGSGIEHDLATSLGGGGTAKASTTYYYEKSIILIQEGFDFFPCCAAMWLEVAADHKLSGRTNCLCRVLFVV